MARTVQRESGQRGVTAEVSALSASVSGGEGNTASAKGASVSGGEGLSQPAMFGWAAGSVTPGNTINGDFESP
jgi:hypothetical protein